MERVELFYNDENEYVGFAGLVKMRDKEIFVNSKTGEGFDVWLQWLKASYNLALIA